LDIAAVSDHIVVSATRTPTSASESGGAISIIAREDLLRANQSVLSESLRSVPGFSVVQTGGRGGLTSIFVRGGESDYNKVLIDGVAVNEAGGLFDFAALTPENLERVEVVRGPRSALFGSDAMTSVIQLVTRRGSTAVPEFELSAEGGSFDHHRETAQLSGLARWFDYSGSFGYQTSGGRFENMTTPTGQPRRTWGFSFHRGRVCELRRIGAMIRLVCRARPAHCLLIPIKDRNVTRFHQRRRLRIRPLLAGSRPRVSFTPSFPGTVSTRSLRT